MDQLLLILIWDSPFSFRGIARRFKFWSENKFFFIPATKRDKYFFFTKI
jgi:hypothetical protein